MFKRFGMKRRYAAVMFDLFVEALSESLIENKKATIVNFGKFSIEVRNENRIFAKFKASDILRCKILGIDPKEYSNKKHRHMKDGTDNEYTE